MTFRFIHSFHDEKLIEVPAIGLGLRVPLPPDMSDGAVSIIETVNAPGFGPPLHRHPQTEVFRVLEGRYLYVCDGRKFETGVGDVVSIPGGASHTFVNISDAPARQYILMIPSLDAVPFFTGLGEVMRDGVPAPAVLAAFGRKWDVEFLGPPLKADD
jgi:quercetin dioxygenase-like cupin family protein